MKTLSFADEKTLEDILVHIGYDIGGPGYGPKVRAALGDLGALAEANELALVQDYGAPLGAATLAAPPASSLGALILAVAKPFVGLYETVDNTQWAMTGSSDRTEAVAFKALLEGVGWEPPESYCMAAVKAWWKAAFAQAGRTDWERYAALLDLSALDSFNQCHAAGLITHDPQPGAIAFMQHGDSSLGHAWLFRGESNGRALTREANTSLDPDAPANQDRDGGCVADKSRPLDFTPTAGLHLKGFLNPPD